jgi:molecular chaperone DnaK
MYIEKLVRENGDKLSEDDKKKLTDACDEAKKHLTSEYIEELKKVTEDLTAVSNEVFTRMYQNMQQNAPQGDANNGANNGGDDEVIVE